MRIPKKRTGEVNRYSLTDARVRPVPWSVRIFRNLRWSHRVDGRICLAFCAAAYLFSTHPLTAQTQPADASGLTASDHVVMLTINGLIGGVSAGVVGVARGDSFEQAFWDRFLKGALGGGISYAGKYIASREFDGAGLLGRQINALGASTTANAADGLGPFDRVIFPLGPLPGRLLMTRGSSSGFSLRPMVDLLSTAGFIYGLADSDYVLDWDASLSGGVAVFQSNFPRTEEERMRAWASSYRQPCNGGAAIGGTIFSDWHTFTYRTIAHEQVHTLQFDYVSAVLGDRVDTWAMSRLSSVDRWLKINLIPAFFSATYAVFPTSAHDIRPWEQEAAELVGRP